MSAGNDNAELVAIATRLLDAEAAAKRFRTELLSRMEQLGAKRVDVPGSGFVSYSSPTTSTPIDGKACALKLEALGARLRAMGINDVDDAVPMGVSDRRASVRVTLRAA